MCETWIAKKKNRTKKNRIGNLDTTRQKMKTISQKNRKLTQGSLLMESLIVVAITATVAAFGLRSLAMNRVGTQLVESRAQTTLRTEAHTWTLADQSESVEIGGQTVNLKVWTRTW